MHITLRPLNPATDLPRLAALINTTQREPITPEILADKERRAPEGLIRHRTAAIGGDGLMAGYGEASRAAWDPPGRFALQVVVDPAMRGRGIGAALYADVIRFARDHGASRFRTRVRDDAADSLRWARGRGFQIDHHMFESTLDLTAFDEAPFAGAVEAAEAAGFRFATLAELGDTDAVRRQVYDQIARTAADDPSSDGAFPPFEMYCQWAFDSPWSRPDLLHVAMDGDRMVAHTLVRYFAQTKTGQNNGTGVEREYRGRRLTLAMKLLSIRAARQIGAERLVTKNDSRNAAMLAVNRKLGYQPQPGTFLLTAP